MRYKNNITLRSRNIRFSFSILKQHLTDKLSIIISKPRIIMLYFLSLILGFINITNTTSTYSLNYQSKVGVGLTLNPSLSISMSSNDLVIPDLVAGSYDDSNSTNVLVSSNTLSGYTVSVNTNNEKMESSSSYAFTSLDVDADLPDLSTADDNTWGYSYSLDNGSTWSNYSGLSININKTLYDTISPADNKTLGFKIGAKASSNQPSGVYSTTLNFIAVSRVTPMSLLDSYRQAGKTMVNGYYTMQDMTTDICNNTDIFDEQLEVIDIRDNNVYWIAKLHTDKDNPNIGQCRMTENLDLNLETTPDKVLPLTSENTDLNLYGSMGYTSANGYSCSNPTNPEATLTADCSGKGEIITWAPVRSTIPNGSLSSTTWTNSTSSPYSYDSGLYSPNGLMNGHGYTGNYYNWSAAVASNNSGSYNSGNAPNSICPAGWRLPNTASTEGGYEFSKLLYAYGITTDDKNTSGYATGGNNKITSSPLYFVKSGYISNGALKDRPYGGRYWSNSVLSSSLSLRLDFDSNSVTPSVEGSKGVGFSVRCIAR